jgi:hypothetical protein
MAAFNTAINSFLSGELSPKVFGRSETDQFKQACEELTNMAVYPQGGAFRRPGTKHINTIDQSLFYTQSTVRLFPFVAANGKKFVFIAYPGVFNAWKILNVQTGLYETNFPAIGMPTLIASQLKEVQFAQIGDLTFFAHPDFRPFALRYDGVNFTFSYYDEAFPGIVDLWNRRPFLIPELNDVNGRGTITASAKTGTITLTSSAGIFQVGHVGAYFKLTEGGTTGVVQISVFTNSTTVTATVVSTLSWGGGGSHAFGGTLTSSWEEQAWSDARGWPRSLLSYEQRLYFGGTRSQPSTVWGSEQGDIKEFMSRPFEQDTTFSTYLKDNTRPFDFTIANESSLIQWMSAGESLTIGTELREHVCVSNESIGLVNVPQIRSSTTYGSSYVQAIRKDNQAFFIPRNGQQVRDMSFNNDEQAYKSDDITLLCEHLPFKSLAQRSTVTTPVKITAMTCQQNPYEILWNLTNNGDLIGITVNKDAKIQAGHFHILGGVSNVSNDAPRVHSVCNLPSSVGAGSDELFLAVERRINGNTRIYLEKLTDEFRGTDPHDTSNPMVYLDSSISISGALANTFTGLGHLEGQTVSVLGDGKDAGDAVVTGGQITLSNQYAKVTIGLKYKSRLVTSNIETGSPVGSSQGLMKKVHQGIIRFYKTAAAKYGRKTQSQLDSLVFKPASLPSNAAIPLFTDDKFVMFPAAYDRKAQIAIETDRPLPMSVTAVALRGITYDG